MDKLDNKIIAALIQMEVFPGEVEKNRQTAERMLRQAVAKGARLLVLPELWNCGYRLERLPELGETINGESVSMLCKIAMELNVFIFGGSIGEKKGDKFYNTAVAIDANGELVAKYRKVHLFRKGLMEHEYFTVGDKWTLCETPWCRAGMMVCYDLRFPEFSRNLALRGAKMLVYPAQWPEARLTGWRALPPARAVENECFVLAANRCGEDDFVYPGHSMLVGPWGNIIAEGGRGEELVMGELDFGLLAEEKSMKVLADRHRILDEIDDSQI